MITIDQESKQSAKITINSDFLAARYKTSNNLVSFPSPSYWTIDKNLFYLLKNATRENFEQKYTYRPDYLSIVKYGTSVLWYLLMYVNGIFCIEDFDMDIIVIPTMSSIIDIAEDKFPILSSTELQGINW